VNLERMIQQLARYLTGWRGYFGFCETRSVLATLDLWIRRRLRCFAWKQWKQWKRGKTHFAELRKRSVGKDLEAQTAGSRKGLWHLSRRPALNIALSGAYFELLGLPKLSNRLEFNQPNSRGTDPYARWCDRDSPRGPTYVD